MKRVLRNTFVASLLVGSSLWWAAQASDDFTLFDTETPVVPAPATRNGLDIYRDFREGLSTRTCPSNASARWSKHFSLVPSRLASGSDDALPLFGYVVDELRRAGLPTEYALIPFVESGYQPGARSPGGPAGLWQMIALTARDHKVNIGKGYDGRLSPVESTRAAVRYLKTLHGMFAGDWRLAAMAYNAGEYRVLGSLRAAGQTARNARPHTLPGLSGITHAYVRKLQAISCLMARADDQPQWLSALDRPVPRLEAVALPDDIADLRGWAEHTQQDPDLLRRLNPVFGNGRIAKVGGSRPMLLSATLAATGAIDQASPAAPLEAMSASLLDEAAMAPSTDLFAAPPEARPLASTETNPGEPVTAEISTTGKPAPSATASSATAALAAAVAQAAASAPPAPAPTPPIMAADPGTTPQAVTTPAKAAVMQK